MENFPPPPPQRSMRSNMEHMEAYREATSSYIDGFTNTLSEHQQKQINALKDAYQILVDAKVPAHIYSLLPSNDPKRNINSFGFFTEEIRKLQIYQYDTLDLFLEKNEDSTDLSYESMILRHYFDLSMAHMFISNYITWFPDFTIDNILKRINLHKQLFYDWSIGKNYPPSIQKLIDDHGPI